MGVKRSKIQTKQNFKKTKKDAKEVEKRDHFAQFKRAKKTVKVSSKTVNHSICIPTTVLDNCKNLEQITYTLYQIARSACIFNVSEIVILEVESEAKKHGSQDTSGKSQGVNIKFDQEDVANDGKKNSQNGSKSNTNKLDDKKRLSKPMLMASLLQFFVTPPYLVNSVFKKDYMKYFTYAKQLPKISSLPFMRYYQENQGRYREGLAIRMSKPGERGKSKKSFDQTKYINIGKGENLELKGQLVPINVRVTVDTVEQKVVSPEEAYGDFVGAKASFGYHVRVAKSFADLFTQSPFPQGYTQTVWINSGDFFFDKTLKKNVKVLTQIPAVEKVVRRTEEEILADPSKANSANLLAVFGKWEHIKKSFESCKEQFEGASGAYQFFDGELSLPGTTPQGIIRTEDACTIALTLLSTF
ncbi:unnamed protein product [Kluyveromyces dobzhanskii CBS 2104]|uniref:WGS project CCBQ000000000 data, contig 00015 n=1 Tax=Kluyveromyces dobzhanskii CBS 2104 TaxID=1427455 RepID=A0A0A8LBI0_9SACH|nr:unnamed protein product [Kluyveromyces dobzhanskii CBS 2104]